MLLKNSSICIILKNNFFQTKQPREDYRELLELIIIFLGGTPVRASGKDFQIRAPGAMHHARWMSKAIYSLKMYIFREEINISQEDLYGLRKINIFIAVMYAKVWFTADKPEKAPNTDLQFLIDLCNNSTIDE